MLAPTRVTSRGDYIRRAVRLQLVLLYVLLGSVGLAALTAVHLAYRNFFAEAHQFASQPSRRAHKWSASLLPLIEPHRPPARDHTPAPSPTGR